MSDEDEIDFDELQEKAKKILKKLKEDSDRIN